MGADTRGNAAWTSTGLLFAVAATYATPSKPNDAQVFYSPALRTNAILKVVTLPKLPGRQSLPTAR
jgi:hypothetical protein